MLDDHARLVRLVRLRCEGLDDAAVRASIVREDPAWLEALGDCALPADPLTLLVLEASLQTPLTEETLAALLAAGTVAESPDEVWEDWDLETRALVARIESAFEAIGGCGTAAADAADAVVETLVDARGQVPRDWFEHFDEPPYVDLLHAGGRTLGRIEAWSCLVPEDVRRNGRSSEWYDVYRGMVEAAPESVPPDLIRQLVALGEGAYLKGIPVERWPHSAVLWALRLDVFDHIASRVDLAEGDLPLLRSLLADPEHDVRVVQNLHRLGARARSVAPLLEAELEAWGEGRAAHVASWADRAVRALDAIGGPGLRTLASSAVPGVRRVAARVLAETAPDAAEVVEAMRDPDPRTRREVLAGLRAEGGPEAVRALKAALDDTDAHVRRRALDGLAAAGPPDLEHVLREAAQDTEASVRWTAKWWLRECGYGP